MSPGKSRGGEWGRQCCLLPEPHLRLPTWVFLPPGLSGIFFLFRKSQSGGWGALGLAGVGVLSHDLLWARPAVPACLGPQLVLSGWTPCRNSVGDTWERGGLDLGL